MSFERTILTEEFDWRGIIVSVALSEWLGHLPGPPGSWVSLEMHAVSPDHAPLPVSRTGCIWTIVSADGVEEIGGPVAYATAWLDAARDPKWIASEAASRQLNLF